MARKSSLKTLPKKVLDAVNKLLVDDVWTLDQVVEYLSQAGHPRSRSAVGRHAKNITAVAAKLAQSREMAAALVKEIGPDAVEGKTGRLLVEILQKLLFDHLINKVEGDAGAGVKSGDFFFLAKAMKEMASAQKIDVDRELKVRAEAAKEMRRKAAAAVDKAVRGKGLTKGTVKDIKQQILGIEVE